MRVTTQDIFYGAYLLSQGMILEEVQLTGGREHRPAVTFIFSGENADKLSREFQTGKANANVASFKVAMNHLKDVMFDTLRQNGTR